jgi:hypothetical protein
VRFKFSLLASIAGAASAAPFMTTLGSAAQPITAGDAKSAVASEAKEQLGDKMKHWADLFSALRGARILSLVCDDPKKKLPLLQLSLGVLTAQYWTTGCYLRLRRICAVSG